MYEVSDKSIMNTQKCSHDFSCLKNGKCGNRELCKVAEQDGENVLFLVSNKQIKCNYNLSFGFSHICTCPVRYEISMKYRI